jgi:hypothetical protein
MKTALFAAVISAILTTSCLGEDKTQKSDPNQPKVKELLNKFLEARKNFTSFILETGEETTFDYPANNWSGKRHQKIEYRFDGARGRLRFNMWGTVSNAYPNVTKDKSQYLSFLWDGENFYRYSPRVAASDPEIVMMTRGTDPGGVPKEMTTLVQTNDAPGLMMGYVQGERIDEILAGAEHLEMKQEKLRGVDCYVIDAAVKEHGNYTLWIDPAHDHHIVKSRIRQKEGDYYYAKKLPKNSSRDTVLEVTDFQQIGGSWFLKQFKTTDRTIDGGNLGGKSQITDITNIVLNPDHDALKSFIPDDIRNGASVFITALPLSINYIWQDGKVIDKAGKIIMDCTLKKQKI